MSTRAVYSFKDSSNTFHVYKHHDGYPSGAVQWILAALPYAWKLPRFEASEFATAFIAANKELKESLFQGGDVYLTHGHGEHGDLDYRYEITFNGSYLIVHAYEIDNYPEHKEQIIFEGTLEQFCEFNARKE